MAPAQSDPGIDLGIEFEALRGPVVKRDVTQNAFIKAFLKRWNAWLEQLRHYG